MEVVQRVLWLGASKACPDRNLEIGCSTAGDGGISCLKFLCMVTCLHIYMF